MLRSGSRMRRGVSTQMGFLCAPVPPALSGRLNEHSTRADMNWLVNQIGHELDGDAPLPAIQVPSESGPGYHGDSDMVLG